MSDERLRLSYDRLLAVRAAMSSAREGCPEVDAMLEVLRREGTEDARLDLLDHIMACPFCQAEFALLKTAGTAQPPE
jgi:hypothetical protein